MLAAKPICVIKVSDAYIRKSQTATRLTWAQLNEIFSKKLSDYHVFVIPAANDPSEPQEDFQFQVFFDKDVKDISIEELKKLIQDSLN